MNSRIAVGFLVVAIAYAFEVGEFLVSESVQNYLNTTGKVFAVLGMLVIFHALWPILTKKISKLKCHAHESESYITDVLHTSIRTSWVVALLSLTVFMVMDNLRARLGLPTDFYFKLLFCIMMFTVSIDFLIRTRLDESVEQS